MAQRISPESKWQVSRLDHLTSKSVSEYEYNQVVLILPKGCRMTSGQTICGQTHHIPLVFISRVVCQVGIWSFISLSSSETPGKIECKQIV